jgi:NAD(P)-dependent dehydrogenase (short-subunit alcohol dehydrogenase family)
MKRLQDKVAIITGGAGSIGKVTAKIFLSEGAKVMLVDINKTDLEKVVAELGSENVRFCVADVSKAKDVENYVDETVKQFGKIDVFFNNAGIEGVVSPIVDYPEDIFDQVIAVNVKGVWQGNKYVIPQMNDGGSIAITSSVAGVAGFPQLGAYAASNTKHNYYIVHMPSEKT